MVSLASRSAISLPTKPTCDGIHCKGTFLLYLRFEVINYICRGADDRAAYVSLLKELRQAFEGEAKTSGQPRLLLSAAVPASFEAIAAGYDVPEISKYLVRVFI